MGKENTEMGCRVGGAFLNATHITLSVGGPAGGDFLSLYYSNYRPVLIITVICVLMMLLTGLLPNVRFQSKPFHS